MENKTYCISEIGINHNGDMKLAKELIDISANAGCQAVKLQKRTIELVYTKDELDANRESPWGTTNRQQKEGLEFSIEQHKELQDYANSKGLEYFVSCWDLNSVDLVDNNLNVKYHKVASALLTDKEFLIRLKDTGKKIILSTGMSTEEEIDAAIKIVGQENVEYILACTSTYPTSDDEVNLNYIRTLKEKYPSLKIGFSNHCSGFAACFGAVALGAECVEFHITKDRTSYGSDQAASIENAEELVSGIRKMENMLGDGKKVVFEREKSIAKKLRKVNTILAK